MYSSRKFPYHPRQVHWKFWRGAGGGQSCFHESEILSHLVNCHSTVTLIVSKLITLRSLHNHRRIWEIRESQRNCLSKEFIESELTVGHDPFRISLLFLDALKIKYQDKELKGSFLLVKINFQKVKAFFWCPCRNMNYWNKWGFAKATIRAFSWISYRNVGNWL